jgi:cytochrome c-type biogenesis protein CcmF
MIMIGNLAVLLALIASAYSVAASVYGGLARRNDFIASGRHAAHTCTAMVAIATTALLHGLITHDFSLKYVAHYSSTTLPLRFRIAALWGGMEGSLLFWVLILVALSSLVLLQNRSRNRELMPYVTATTMTVAVFFLALLQFITPPFAQLAFVPLEGGDLNPLLQNYWMQIHPPALYLGYVTWTIPFGFAVAALVTGHLDDLWIRTSRRWSLAAWFFLACGNILGARWAYEVLGWGGYWAWDPVENAAFMPLMTGTAYLHSVMIQERKDMLKVWNMTLIILTFCLTIFGTFLTRSGVISSVHSFTQSGLGPFFLGFLAAVIVVTTALTIRRLPELRPKHQLDSMLSRESAFLFNNLLLVGIAFATFWGTIFPVLSEWVRGVKITVGPPFFNRVNAPLAIGLLFLMGVGPLIAWRRSSVEKLLRTFLVPALVGILAGAAAFVLGIRDITAVLVISFSSFVLYTIVFEFHRGAAARVAMVGQSYIGALFSLLTKNQRRYGGYVVHLGVVFMFIGVAMSSIYRVEEMHTISIGESFSIGPYTLRYDAAEDRSDDHMARMVATLTVFENGKEIAQIAPEKRFYRKPEQPATEVDFRTTWRDDLYVILGSIEPEKTATFQAYINPMVVWLWIGGFVIIAGTGICILPTRKARQREQAREAAISRNQESA